MPKNPIRNIQYVPGFRASGVACGIKASRLKDLALIVSDTPAMPAAVFTKNQVPSPSVVFSRHVLKQAQTIRAILVNSGNANACTGKQGLEDCRAITQKTAQTLGIDFREILMASTGVIGIPLPRKTIIEGISSVIEKLSDKGWAAASEAILTTDLVVKTAQTKVKLDERTITIGGLAKGSGMIHPNMATMLAFIVTDAKMGRKVLQSALKVAVDPTFNAITVDGECSTNDCVIALANGKAGNALVKSGSSDFKKFVEALTAVCRNLAWKVVEDGEGATKFVTVCVGGGRTSSVAKQVAQQVATSNLVKTAMFGQDSNWGRIIAAVGNAQIPLQHEKIEIRLGGIILVQSGQPRPVAKAKLGAIMKKKSIRIDINLNQGNHRAEVYTCDLSYDYVKINAEYTT